MSKRVMLWCGFLFAVYVWLALPRIGLPVLAEELSFPGSAMLPMSEAIRILPHPVGYLGLLKLLLHVGVPAGPWLRVLGLLSFGVTIGLTAALANQLTARSGWLAALLWTLHPMAVQGSQILEIDTTLLTVAVTAFLVLVVAWPLELSRRQLGWIGIGFAGCLWVKLSCAPFLLLAVALRGWSARQWRLGWNQMAGVGGTAACVFLSSWIVVCHLIGIPWTSIFRWVVLSTYTGSGSAVAWSADVLSRSGRIGLWITPWLLLLLVVVARWVGRRAAADQWRWWCVLGVVGAIMAGYFLVRGTAWGFPKYHAPALPAAVAAVAALSVRLVRLNTPRKRLMLGVAGIVAALYFWNVGDLLYQFNYPLRLAFMTGAPPVSDALHRLWVQGMFYVLPGLVIGVAVWRGSSRQRWSGYVMGLLVLLAGSSAALDLRQRQAPYATTYHYGRPWSPYREAIHWVSAYRQEHPHGKIVGPPDLLWSAGIPMREVLGLEIHARDAIQAAVDDPSVSCIVYGISTNDLKTWRTLLQDPGFLQHIQQRFTRLTLGEGEYTVWVRKEKGVESGAQRRALMMGERP